LRSHAPRHGSETREDQDRPPPARAAGAILELQRSAGNAAVSALLARAPTATATETPKAKLRRLLQDGDEEWAIAHLASVTAAEAGEILADPGLRALAVETFDDEEMGRAMQGLAKGVRLVQKLNWMEAEGSNLGLVWPLLIDKSVPEHEKTEVYERKYLRAFFIDICGDDEMAAIVRVLGGTLEQKLDWMLGEGTNWKAIRPLLADPAVDKAEKLKLYESREIRNKIVEELDHDQVLEAVGLLGGTLSQKLNWLYVNDTNWKTVKRLISDPKLDPAEKLKLYEQDWARKLFVEVCGNAEMAEAVSILGGKPDQKLRWMIDEGTSADLVFALARATAQADLLTGGLPRDIKVGLRSELSGKDYQRAEQMLTRGLLTWEEIDESRTESHYELKDEDDPTKGYKLEDFKVKSIYEMNYSRTELRVRVRIRLTGNKATPAHIAIWQNGIDAKWNRAFHVENDRRIPIVFEPDWNGPSAHHSIELKDPPVEREDAAHWYAGPNANPGPGAAQDTTDANTAAHEFGHLIGLADEYNLTAGDYQKFTGTAPPAGPAPASGYSTTSVMANITGPVEGRHMRPFVDWLNRNRLPGEKPYRLVAGP
jgi:hypothetical protein